MKIILWGRVLPPNEVRDMFVSIPLEENKALLVEYLGDEVSAWMQKAGLGDEDLPLNEIEAAIYEEYLYLSEGFYQWQLKCKEHHKDWEIEARPRVWFVIYKD